MGFWQTKLKPIPDGGPYSLEIVSGKEKIEFSGLIMGDVFIASGQSNMEWKLKQPINNGREAILFADKGGRFACEAI